VKWVMFTSNSDHFVSNHNVLGLFLLTIPLLSLIIKFIVMKMVVLALILMVKLSQQPCKYNTLSVRIFLSAPPPSFLRRMFKIPPSSELYLHTIFFQQTQPSFFYLYLLHQIYFLPLIFTSQLNLFFTSTIISRPTYCMYQVCTFRNIHSIKIKLSYHDVHIIK